MAPKRPFRALSLFRRTDANPAKIARWKESIIIKSNFVDDTTRIKQLRQKAAKLGSYSKDTAKSSSVLHRLLVKDSLRRCGIWGARRAKIMKTYFELQDALLLFGVSGKKGGNAQKKVFRITIKMDQLLGSDRDRFYQFINTLAKTAFEHDPKKKSK